MGCWQTLVGVSCVLHSANMPSRLLLLIVIHGVLTRQTQHDIVTFYDDNIAHRPAESDMFSRARIYAQEGTSMELVTKSCGVKQRHRVLRPQSALVATHSVADHHRGPLKARVYGLVIIAHFGTELVSLM